MKVARKAPCCAICSADKRLTEHHIHPREFAASYPAGPAAIDEAANRVILCAGCHQAVHKDVPFTQLARDIKTKLRRGPRVRATHDDEQLGQSLRDQALQHAVWRQLLVTLEDKAACRRIENYQRIIRTVKRLHETENQD